MADDKDKIIMALAIGFLAVTGIASANAVVQYQRFGVRPIVNLTDFHVENGGVCTGSVHVSFLLTNTGRDGFAQVEVVVDKASVVTNSYRLSRGETRSISEVISLGNCAAHEFAARVTTTWA